MNAKIDNPYVGPRTFQENERDRFFGREREARDLLALAVSEQLALFYAQSGAGKSSLVNTCLIPDLRARGFEIFTGRVAGDAPSGIPVENIYVYNLIRGLAADETALDSLAAMTLNEFFSKLKKETPLVVIPSDKEQAPKPRALIIDQFEEIFSTHHEAWEKREGFFQQLAEAMQSNPYLWVILIMREDFIAALDPYTYLLPGRLRMRYYMQRLERGTALEAIKKPVKDLRPYAEGVAEKLVDDLASIKIERPDGTLDIQPGQYVEPVQLQVVCYSLWENLPPEGKQITEQDLQDVGDVNQSLGKYYDGRVSAVAKAKAVKERLIREWFEKKLITLGGIRNMVLRETRGREGELSDDIIQALQSDLIRAEKRGASTFYELTHDRLVEPIIASNKKWKDLHVSLLHRQAELWDQKGRSDGLLLGGQDLVTAEGESTSDMTHIEQEFLSACRKLGAQVAHERQQNRLRTILAIGATIAFIIAFWQAIQAKDSETAALLAQATAISAQNIALTKEAEAIVLADSTSARELASAAKSNLDNQLDLSILLSLEAYMKKNDHPEAQSALYSSMQRALRLRGYLTTAEDPAEEFRYSPSYNPDGNYYMAALIKDGGLKLWKISDDGLESVPITIRESEAVQRLNYELETDKFIFNPNPDSKQLIYLSRGGLNFLDIEKNEPLIEDPVNGHNGAVTQIVFSADGNTFATLGENANVILWRIDKGKITPLNNVDDYDGDSVAFSPDGSRFAVLNSQSDDIVVKNMDGTAVTSPTVPESDTVTSIAFDQSGGTLAMGIKGGSIIFWDLNGEKQRDEVNTGQMLDIRSIIFDSTGKFLAYATEQGIRTKVDIDNPKSDMSNPGTSFAASTNGDIIAITSAGEIKLLGNNDDSAIDVSHSGGNLIAFSSDSGKVAVYITAEENTIRVVGVKDEDKEDDHELKMQSDYPVSAMAFSRDGAFLAVGSNDGRVELWNIASQELQWTETPQPDTEPDTGPGAVSSLAFSPDGSALLAGYEKGGLSILNVETGALSDSREIDYPGRITSFNFSPAGNFLYSLANDGMVLVNALTLKEIEKVVPIPPNPEIQFIGSLEEGLAIINKDDKSMTLYKTANGKQIVETIQDYWEFSPNENFLAVKQGISGEENETDISLIDLLDSTSGEKIIDSIEGDDVEFSSDNNTVAISNNRDGIVTLWNVARNIQIGESIRGSDPKFASGQNVLAVTSGENIILLDTTNAMPIGSPIKGETACFSPDGKVLASFTSMPANITLWDTAKTELIGKPIPGEVAEFYSETTAPLDCTTLDYFGIGPKKDLMLISNNAIFNRAGYKLWNITTGELVGGPFIKDYPILSPGQKFLVATTYYSGSVLWSLEDNKPVATLFGRFVKFSPDDNLLIMKNNNDNSIAIWNTTTGRQIHETKLAENVIFNPPYANIPVDIVFSPDNSTFANFNSQGSLTLWDTYVSPSIPGTPIDLRETCASLANGCDPVLNTAINSNGNRIAILTQDRIKIFEKTGNNSFLHHENQGFENNHIKEVSSVAVSPTGNRLILSSKIGSSLSLWDPINGTKKGETIYNEAYRFFFSPNGNILVTSPYRYTYILRDAETGNKIGYPLFGSNLQFSSDGQYVAVSNYNFYSNDDTYTIFNVAENQMKQVGEQPILNFRGFGPNGEHTAIVSTIKSDSYSIYLVDFENKNERIERDYTSRYYPTISPDKILIAIATSTSTYEIRDIKTGNLVRRIENIQGSFGGFSPNNKIAYLYDYDKGELVLYDISMPDAPGETVSAARIDSGDVIYGEYLTFSPTGKYALAYYQSGYTLWESETGRKIGKLRGQYQSFIGNDDKILITTKDNEVNLFHAKDLSDALPQDDPYLYPGILNGARSIPHNDDSFIVFGSSGAILLEFANLQLLESPAFGDRTGAAREMVLSPDSESLATVGSDGLIVWDISDKKPSGKTLLGEEGAQIITASFTKDNNSIVYLDQNRNIYKVDIGEIPDLKEYPDALDKDLGICSGGLSPNGNYVVSYHSGKLQIWDVDVIDKKDSTDKKPISEWKLGSCPILMAFDQQKTYFVYVDSETNRNRIYFVDNVKDDNGKITSFKEPVELYGITIFDYYNDLTLISSSDKKYLLARANGRVLIWDIDGQTQIVASNETGEPMITADGKIVIFLPSENEFVELDFGNLGAHLTLWRDELCKKVTRPLSLSEWQPFNPGMNYQTDYKDACS